MPIKALLLRCLRQLLQRYAASLMIDAMPRSAFLRPALFAAAAWEAGRPAYAKTLLLRDAVYALLATPNTPRHHVSIRQQRRRHYDAFRHYDC